MQKIKALLTESTELRQLNSQAYSRAFIYQLWQNSAPPILVQSSQAISLENGQLNVLANSAIVANKIKLTQVDLLSSLLTQLQNLQKKEPSLRECKVTSISVKVQVKSTPRPALKSPRIISAKASTSLKKLAKELGDSALSQKLNSLANKR
jgi:hypothetical protein